MINVKPLPQINLTPNVSVCITDSVQVTAQGGGIYSWTPAGLTSQADIPNPFLIPTIDTRFIVEVLGTNNCTEWDTVDVKVNPLPTINLTSDTTICEGTSAQLWATGGIDYSWSPSTYLSNPIIARPVSSTVVPIQYQVTVIDGNNCIDSAQVDISINVTPESNFDYTYVPSCPGFDTKFTDKSVNADQWSWVFGDGATSTEASPSHIYEFGQSVTTYLITGNNKLCFDTLAIDLNWKDLEDFIAIYAPNVITPNGDKMNDCFDYTVEGDFELCTNLQVFNRWGMKVYDSLDSKTCFQGINEYNFQALPSGTYFYTLSINDYNKNGFITVVADK